MCSDAFAGGAGGELLLKAAASVPLTALEDEDVVELALPAIGLRLDGKAAAATVARRKRAVFYNVLDLAATGKRWVLTRNPLDTMRRKPPEVAEKVDRRVVVNPARPLSC